MSAALWSAAALPTGFVLDLLFGDPRDFPHITRWIGRLVAALEVFFRRKFPADAHGAHDAHDTRGAHGAHDARGAYGVPGTHDPRGAHGIHGIHGTHDAHGTRGAYGVPGTHDTQDAHNTRGARRELLAGRLLVCSAALICVTLPFALLFFAYRSLPPFAYALESLLCWQLLSAKSLKTESMKVSGALMSGDLAAARESVSMIVGRDTAELDSAGVSRAAVETVAENASDGVAAPLMYMMLGGAPLGCLYKAVNTMDSMLGYKSDRYLYFGHAAAKTDDVFNYIPSRLCALLMIAAAFLLGFDGRNALRVWRRDRGRHASPNSAQTESVCAGALGIQLGGPSSYSGVIADKPAIGDAARPIRVEDIADANRLMYAAAAFMLILAFIVRLIWIRTVLYGN